MDRTPARLAQASRCTRMASAALALGGLTALLAACGGGNSDAPSSLFDGLGPGNPSSCPRSQPDDIWFDRRLGCLAAGQRFIQGTAVGGDRADRAYIFGQEVLDTQFVNVLGANLRRYFKYTLCVRAAPANLSPTTLASDLGAALGLNTLNTGRTFYPTGVAGSTFAYGGLVDDNTVATPCDPARHAVIVDYASTRIHSVNPAALSQVQTIDR